MRMLQSVPGEARSVVCWCGDPAFDPTGWYLCIVAFLFTAYDVLSAGAAPSVLDKSLLTNRDNMWLARCSGWGSGLKRSILVFDLDVAIAVPEDLVTNP